VGRLSRFSHNPGKDHWAAVKVLLRYLKGTTTTQLTYSRGSQQFDPVSYSDSDWDGDEDRKSISGFVILLGGAPVMWKSKKHSTVALSTMEAEYGALHTTTRNAMWLASSLGNKDLDPLNPHLINLF
jgi:hypothetical protein